MQLVQNLFRADLAHLRGGFPGCRAGRRVAFDLAVADHPRDLVGHGPQHVFDARVHLRRNVSIGQAVHAQLELLLLFQLASQLDRGNGQGPGLHGVRHRIAVTVDNLAATGAIHVGTASLVVGLLAQFVADDYLHPKEAPDEQRRDSQKRHTEPIDARARDALLRYRSLLL